MTLPLAPPPQELADAFDLDLQQRSIGELTVWLSDGDEEEDAGDTTGDGCGESPPQGPTTGC
ncbi:hypothetical protein [Streptomyces alkaliterrae]|uniref:Uncharacterized protein n=1 Tax=Streptomyces alkaliterrae TaxID=2213162 RepID=A0A5P0YSZ9_9ACTN|nr:hypothetical protein [Streptomyces alkaliterrae]MBB1261391.1 hypothetical protein [Streptomyces alkaliterrae]MQS03444.1 hypothetical protein [Streptomyces alkaliterrae]